MKKTKPPHYWHEAKKFLSKKDKKLAKIINQYDGHLVTRNDPFYSLCRSIIGQQISVKAADSIWLKFEKAIKKIKPINLIKLPSKTCLYWVVAPKNFIFKNDRKRIF